jgi:hypothetical protein
MNCWYCDAPATETHEIRSFEGILRVVPVGWGVGTKPCILPACTNRKPMPEDLWGAGLEASTAIIEAMTTGQAAEERSRWQRLADRLRGR